MGKRSKRKRPKQGRAAGVPVVNVAAAPMASGGAMPAITTWDTGEKFFGGFGPTELLALDYWTLRARSAQLFETNLYARGLIRAFVENVINTGLHLEATPEEAILGFDDDELADWSEDVETRFSLWAKLPWLCDRREQETFGALQATAFREALIEGDVLAVLRRDPLTKMPKVQLVAGSSVINPGIEAAPPEGHRIDHGVELDATGRHVAYYVSDQEGTVRRLEANDSAGRRVAWLIYASDRRHSQVRGKPLLALVLQSMREIDRYRDSAQRKALNNAMLTMVVEREVDGIASRPLAAGAQRVDATKATAIDSGTPRQFNAAVLNPSVVVDVLAPGEKIKPHPTSGTDERFGEFEKAIVQAIAWAHRIPPEILTLAFNSNYSASQAALNEFKNWLNTQRMNWGEAFCQPVYEEWLMASALERRVTALGLLEAWDNWSLYETYAAWVCADWTGHVKPSVDVLKMGKGLELLIALGLTTRDRAAREATGTKFSKNVKKLRRENEQLAEALDALGAQGGAPAPDVNAPEDESADAADTEENDE